MNPPDDMEAFLRLAIERLARRPAPPADAPDYPALVVCLAPPDPDALIGLRATLPPSTCLFWVYAPSDVNAKAIEQAALAASGFTLACPADRQGMGADIAAFLVALLADRRVQLIRHHNLDPAYSDLTSSLDRAIRGALDNLNQDELRGLIRLRSSIRNLPSMWRNVGWRLHPVSDGTPAILCGAGPSLTAHLETIRRLRDRAILIAVGHALPAMVRAGVAPDLVVADDSRAWWVLPDNLDPDTPLVACAELTGAIADRFRRVLWCRGSSVPFTLVVRALGLDLHPAELRRTVTIHAMDVAFRLECGRVALVGQDLSLADDGTLHAEGGTATVGDELLDIPGNEGRTVRTNRDLLSLREAIEDYLAGLPPGSDGQPRVINCTLGGALIRGAGRQSLEEFLAHAPSLQPRPILFLNTSRPTPDASGLDQLTAELSSFRATSLNAVDACRVLRRELERYPLRMPAVRKAQQTLQAAVRQESELIAASRSGAWMKLLSQNADRLCRETPALVSDSSEPAKQLTFLQARYVLLAELTDDVLTLLKPAAAHIAAPDVTTAPLPSATIFDSFRRLGLRLLHPANPEAAAALADRSIWPLTDRFRIRLVNQAHQHVSVRLANGHWHALSALFSMIEEARADVDRAAAAHHFDPTRHGLTLVAPGNWIHAVTWAERFRELDLVIVEPWPELFSNLLDVGCFLHRLPPSVLVLCVGNRFPSWRRIYEERLVRRRHEGRETLVFTPPRCADLPEVQTLLAELRYGTGS